MPKELTHLIVSAGALEKVEKKSLGAAGILKENLDLFMVGSLICDTAYYHIPVFNKKSILCISQAIHNARGDLNKEVIARLTKNEEQCSPDRHFAFLCGVLSHHITDRAFHPPVIYLTGDYHAKDAQERHFAEARHRFLEGLIDGHLAKGSNLDLELKKDGEAEIKREKTVLHPLLLSFVYAALPQIDHKKAEEMALRLFKLSGLQLALLKLYNKSYFRSFILNTNRLFRFRLSNYAAMLYPAAGGLKMPL
ncbi:MAG: zinc dependent phospholipase C family protein, partial [bacterium]|nr:zinc dependent phospholipase C family protein [bacterium]